MSELEIHDWEGGATSFNDMRYAVDLAKRLNKRVRYPSLGKIVTVEPTDDPHERYKFEFPDYISDEYKKLFPEQFSDSKFIGFQK